MASSSVPASCDIAVVGAGAAGLLAAIQAARIDPALSVLALDSQEKLGKKILIAGGGRCNVTNEVVTERDFAGSTPPAIRRVLAHFGVADIRAMLEAQGVTLKREPLGKLFPTTNRARDVLDALLRTAAEAGVRLVHPFRVETLRTVEGGFELHGPHGTLHATRVILATGGRSVPQTGSDGRGLELATELGHTLTPRILPALVPLLLPEEHPLTKLRGIATDATLQVLDARGRVLQTVHGSLLLTHFGISGPAALDISRHFLLAHADDPAVILHVDWLPGIPAADRPGWLRATAGEVLLTRLSELLPLRLASTILEDAGVDLACTGAQLRREEGLRLSQRLWHMALPIQGQRGWQYAEVTAGGVPLRQVRLPTLESRVCPGLHLCGEICDVDGRIGGFNFQWAWASGTVAGQGAARALSQTGGGS
jgi:predicted Rossmann fold flavoprotein